MKRVLTVSSLVLLSGVSLFAADPQLLSLAPSDAQMFAGINVEQAKTSQFGQFLLANIPVNQDFEEFISSTGFDPRADLREVLIASSGSNVEGVGSISSGLVLAKGNFNVSQIVAAAKKEKNVTVSIYAGAQLITFSHDHAQALALLDPSTGIIGGVADVKAALDRQTNPNAIPAAVMTRINQLSSTEDIWSVSTAKFGNLPIPGTGKNGGSAVLDSIQQASAGLKFGAEAKLDAQAVTGSAEDAGSLADVVKLVAQMVQMHSAEGPGAQVTDLLKSLVVSTDSNVVNVSLSLPEDQLESLIRLAESTTGETKI